MKFEALTGPIPTSTEAYWIDIKDLFMYGDTFVNFSKEFVAEDTEAEPPVEGWNPAERHIISLPTAELRRKYLDNSDPLEQFGQFITGPNIPYLEVDGICSLDILSRIMDTSGHAVDPTAQSAAVPDLPGIPVGSGGPE